MTNLTATCPTCAQHLPAYISKLTTLPERLTEVHGGGIYRHIVDDEGQSRIVILGGCWASYDEKVSQAIEAWKEGNREWS